MILEISLKSLYHQKMRTFLTLLGVVIGITAVVSMVSIGAGMTVALEEAIGVLGTDKILIHSKMMAGILGESLSDGDSEAIEDVAGVAFVSPMVSVSVAAKFRGEEKIATVWGLEPAKAERTFAGVSGYDIKEGRWLAKGDKNKIAIGYLVREDYFERKVNAGNTVEIMGQPFQVIGVFEKTGDRDSDRAIYADLDQVRSLLGMGNRLTVIIVRVDPGADVEAVRERIENLLEKKGEKKGIEVATPKVMAEQASAIFKVVQVVFGGLASISLLVGGIGIANTMIMNVLERTHEVGVMKAAGATDAQVMKIFLFESGVIGIFGGSIGVLLGYIISKAINIAAEGYLGPGVLSTAISREMVLFALGFSFAVGVISGVYPAYKASKLNPVEALRG